MNIEDFRSFGILIFSIIIVASTLGAVLLGIAVYKLRKLDIPKNASFSETLLHTPLMVVVGIDLLDLALDILAAPLSWVVLDRLGLKALRGVATVEALIPGTQLIPTLTLCWFGVRILGVNSPRFDQRFIGLESTSTKS